MPEDLLNLDEIILVSNSNPVSKKKVTKSYMGANEKGLKNQLFNTTIQLNGLQEISEIKSANSASKHEFEGKKLHGGHIEQFGGNGLSPVSRDLGDLGCLDEQFTLIEQKEEDNEQITDVYNFVNISKDDAESLMGLFKDFGKDYVTLQLGNGRELKIPKLNLEHLQNNFPLLHHQLNNNVS
jgi:hypothetical protein